MEKLSVYEKSTNIIVEDIGDAYILMCSSDSGDNGIYISDTAIDIFNMCNGNNTYDDIVNSIMSEYDIDMNTCEKDVESCLLSLQNYGAIYKTSPEIEKKE